MEHVIDINDCMDKVKINIKLVGVKKFRFRIKLAELYLRLLKFILPKKIKVEVKTE